LLKHTLPDHPDYHNLEEAISVMNKTGNFINESKREAENKSKLAEINQSLKGKHPSFQKTGRYFLGETAVTLTREGAKSQDHGMVYIATDFLLVTHAIGRGLSQYDGAIDLSTCVSTKAKETPTNLDIVGNTVLFDDEKDRKRFSKVDKKTGKTEQQHFVFTMKSAIDTNRWFAKIEGAKRDYLRSTEQKKE